MTQSYLMDLYRVNNVSLVKGIGATVFDDQGKGYIDFLAGISVNSLGYNHPRITEAIIEQVQSIIHTSGYFKSPYAEELALKINTLISENHSGKVFFASSGAEAVECAIKLAKKARADRTKIIAFNNSFHGRTCGALSVTGQANKRDQFLPLIPGVNFLNYGDFDAIDKWINGETQFVIVEPLQGEGGIIDAPEGFLSELAKVTKAKGAILILDEIQTGLGRCGHWFLFQKDGLDPDIVCMAKALGSGYPISACWAKDEVAKFFKRGDHGSTFGGSPLATRVALETLKELERLDAPNLSKNKEGILRESLSKVPHVKSITGAGLLLGVKLDFSPPPDLAELFLENGLIINVLESGTIRIAPPLVISDEELFKGIEIFEKTLARL